ncbi:hypothetical protein U91I_00528 [alpha proteobacterium U9-1i]|nr:hypothetical protein U91I_00528 [alpha proteobacterium U9-1i]
MLDRERFTNKTLYYSNSAATPRRRSADVFETAGHRPTLRAGRSAANCSMTYFPRKRISDGG